MKKVISFDNVLLLACVAGLVVAFIYAITVKVGADSAWIDWVERYLPLLIAAGLIRWVVSFRKEPLPFRKLFSRIWFRLDMD